jgi:C1A family cysteine protease
MFKKLTFSLLSLLFVFNPISSNNLQNDFDSFIQTHNKIYQSQDEYNNRLEIFSKNIEFIHHHNQMNHSYTLGINQFTDLTSEEFKARFHPLKQNDVKSFSSQQVDVNALPTSLDWRVASQNPKNIVAVTAVKNQEQCGSCWSFSASGATEGAWAISGKGLVSLSEQQLVDCSTSYGNNGCGGGNMDYAFQYIHDKGLCTEASYPYKAQDGTCKSCSPVAHLDGYIDIPDENSILTEIQKGPVSIAIEADQAVFQFYTGGVLDDPSCGNQLDHGVLIVGYGTDLSSKKPYWTVRNSWGSSWGENGYVRIVRNKNMCGIGSLQSRPYYTNKVDLVDFCGHFNEQQCTQNFDKCNWTGPYKGCFNRYLSDESETSRICGKELTKCFLHTNCRHQIHSIIDCNGNLTCARDIILQSNDEKLLELAKCEIQNQSQTSILGFNWDLLFECVGECGYDIIKDIIQCAGDLSHIWDILHCVSSIVGTVSPCYKCIKGIIG